MSEPVDAAAQDETAAPNTATLARRLAIAVVILGLLVVGQSVYTRYATDRANSHAARAISNQKDIVAQLVVVAAQAKSAADAANQTSQQVQAAVSCINALLGARGPLTTADTNAEVDIFTRLLSVLVADPKDQAALYKTFLAETRKDVAVLQKDKMYRADHPLGLC